MGKITLGRLPSVVLSPVLLCVMDHVSCSSVLTTVVSLSVDTRVKGLTIELYMLVMVITGQLDSGQLALPWWCSCLLSGNLP